MAVNKPVILIGGGGHALTLGTVLEDAGVSVLGYIDRAATDLPWPWLGDDDAALEQQVWKRGQMVMAIGTAPQLRAKLFQRFKQAGAEFATFVDRRAFVARSASLGEGCFVHPFGFVGAQVMLGLDVFVGPSAIIEHGARVGDHSFVAQGGSLAGNAVLGACCLVGANASVREAIMLADATTIAMGAAVVAPVERLGTVLAGVPARIRE